MKDLKDILDRFYEDYDFEERLSSDPIQFPHLYSDPRDVEIVAFISSCFAYGRVDLFMPVISSILAKMERHPYDFVLNLDLKKKYLFKNIKYRFNSSDDVLCLLYVLSIILKKYGSLENLFKIHYKDNGPDISSGLKGMINTILNIDTSLIYGKDLKPYGFLQFFPSPEKGSACKRLNLFLRWMIRDRDIDFGIWKGIGKDKLIVPLDTHIARISRCLRLTNRKSKDWKMAVEITKSFKMLDQEDPLKYDFALCHHGISRICDSGNCADCKFFS